MKRCLMGLIASFLLASSWLSAPALAVTRVMKAQDLTSSCNFHVSSNAEDKGLLYDKKHSTAWAAAKDKKQTIEIILPDEQTISGLYIMWNSVPKSWSLEGMGDDGDWESIELGAKGLFINSFIPLDKRYLVLRISTAKGWKCSIAEISVYGPGYLPEDIQVWLPPPEKADLMVIPAHPDDEHIYFGGTLPAYAGQQKKHTVVVYMTSSPMIRKFEALDGLWKVGVREYPVFLPLANKYTSTVEEAELAWDGLDNTVGLLVEQFRQFKPDVVVTHDLDGEYGHGAHKLTALAVTKALKASTNPDKYAASAKEHGVWGVRKCYLHLYFKNKLKMDWRNPLPSFDGETALQMAQAGYDLHVSQHFRERPILDSGEYDNSRFGLYHTSVGQDSGAKDFFEHIVPVPTSTPSPSPTPTPSPTLVVLKLDTPQPSQEAVAAVASIPKGMRITTDSDLAMRVFLSFGAIAFLTFVLFAYWRREKVLHAKSRPRDAAGFQNHSSGSERSADYKPRRNLHNHTGIPPT